MPHLPFRRVRSTSAVIGPPPAVAFVFPGSSVSREGFLCFPAYNNKEYYLRTFARAWCLGVPRSVYTQEDRDLSR